MPITFYNAPIARGSVIWFSYVFMNLSISTVSEKKNGLGLARYHTSDAKGITCVMPANPNTFFFEPTPSQTTISG